MRNRVYKFQFARPMRKKILRMNIHTEDFLSDGG